MSKSTAKGFGSQSLCSSITVMTAVIGTDGTKGLHAIT